MTDVFLAWARAQRLLWDRELRQLAAREKTTFALRDRQQVDTTEETIAEREIQIDEIDALIARAAQFDA